MNKLKMTKKTQRKGKDKKHVKMFTSEKELDTIEDPQNNHTIGDQGGSWTTSLKKCLGAMFQRGSMGF